MQLAWGELRVTELTELTELTDKNLPKNEKNGTEAGSMMRESTKTLANECEVPTLALPPSAARNPAP